jgi:3-hydroxybutyryl-CoA dehydrogenase
VPGFISNAVLMPFINEVRMNAVVVCCRDLNMAKAIMTLEKGVATKEDIDKTLKLGMAHPMGPLELGTWRLADRDSKYDPLTCRLSSQPTCAFIVRLTLNDRSCNPESSIGLDTCLAIQQTLYQGTGDSKYRPSVLLERMVDAKWLGKKSGKGFYDYN